MSFVGNHGVGHADATDGDQTDAVRAGVGPRELGEGVRGGFAHLVEDAEHHHHYAGAGVLVRKKRKVGRIF